MKVRFREVGGSPLTTGVFLVEDHRIASASFLLPDNCRKVSTRAFLSFLEETRAIHRHWPMSAALSKTVGIFLACVSHQTDVLRFPQFLPIAYAFF